VYCSKIEFENQNFAILGGSVDNFGTGDMKKEIRCSFDQWSKLHFSLDAQP
jgi:hypothetical protein